MPYMLRLTNSGIAVHQGYLPGYPASHGCIRVSHSTAKKLWKWSRNGIKVRVFSSGNSYRYASKSKKRRVVKRKSYKKRSYKKRSRYVKRKSYKKKNYKKRTRYVKRKSYKKKSYKKRSRYVKRKSYKKRNYKRKLHKRRAHYASNSRYKIIEIYDSW